VAQGQLRELPVSAEKILQLLYSIFSKLFSMPMKPGAIIVAVIVEVVVKT
jgi:hypothetical protein